MIPGRHYTPARLAREVVRRALGPLRGRRSLSILDPSCGEGIFLEEARRFLGDHHRYVGVDVDALALARAAGGFELIWDNALRMDWGERRFDAVIGNPPWVSFSGRHAKSAEDRDWLAAHYETFAGWPSLHAPFVELAVRLATERIGLLLPEQICDLDGYGALRDFVRRHCDVVATPAFGEHEFSGVIQPCCALILEAGSGYGGDQPFRAVDDPLAHCPRPPPEAFADIGVHTGNCARKLLLPGGTPIREGRDIHPFRLQAPRRTILANRRREEGEYYRIATLERYEGVPILVRQTALRPIAAEHHEPTYFRNSALACMGIEGVPHSAVVEWLNSDVVGWYHRRMVRESNQRTFPQVKVKHLRDLPMPDWDASSFTWEAFGVSAPTSAE